jgi:hypothetical protein
LLATRGIDLGLDFLLAHRRDLECRKPCHGFAEARGGGVARFLLPGAEEVDEIFPHAAWIHIESSAVG